MNELYFTGMDIVEETKAMMNLTDDFETHEMNESEFAAYNLGIEKMLEALRTVVAENDLPVIHINGLEVQTELSIEDLEEYYGSM